MATLRSGTARPAPNDMTLLEHLGELRQRLIYSTIAFAAGTVVTYVLYNRVLLFLLQPLKHADPTDYGLYITSPLEGFAARLDVAAYGGAMLALPVIGYHVWRFVTPGLKAKEKRYAVPFLVSTFLLFLLGGFVAWITFPHALQFLLGASGPHVAQRFSPSKYYGLIAALILIFGATFEFPVVLVGLELMGALSSAALRKARRFAIIGIVVFAAVATPSSDPFSMLALAVPMLVFYELSIGIGRYIERRRARAGG